MSFLSLEGCTWCESDDVVDLDPYTAIPHCAGPECKRRTKAHSRQVQALDEYDERREEWVCDPTREIETIIAPRFL